jgi:hypothetical protein
MRSIALHDNPPAAAKSLSAPASPLSGRRAKPNTVKTAVTFQAGVNPCPLKKTRRLFWSDPAAAGISGSGREARRTWFAAS